MLFYEGAKYIVEKLAEKGFVSYFAGGWVRDYLLGFPSADIDIATSAPPAVIQETFFKTILVGVSFGVVVVIVDNHQYEVTSFRRDVLYLNGRKPEKIAAGTAQEDAERRDFTINGMFYDPFTQDIYDFVGGKADLKLGIIRTIGNPYDRFVEDRLRMVRAVRFSAQFSFVIEDETHKAIAANAYSLFPSVAIERIWQELTKMAAGPNFEGAIIELHRLGLLQEIFPQLKNVHLHEIRKRVALLSLFPKNCPLILCLTPLFPDFSLEEFLQLCKYLKCSNESSRWLEIFFQGLALTLKNKSNRLSWVKFYALPQAEICLQVIALRHFKEKNEEFLAEHAEQKNALKNHIQRIIDKKPIINASLLAREGITSGKNMGELIALAEFLAVENNLHEPAAVLSLLKKSALWP